MSEVSKETVSGAFVRSASSFLGRLGTAEWPVEAGRYVLYVSYACPWASRVLATLVLKGLEHAVQVVPVAAIFSPTKPSVDDHRGWVFRSRAVPGDVAGEEVPEKDPVFGAATLREIYEVSAPPGAELKKFTVPLLVDRVTRRIVCNESSLLVRDFGGALFNSYAKFPHINLYPEEHAAEIDAINDEIYGPINDGVYRCGFARTQEAYTAAATAMLAELRRIEERLSKQRWLVGSSITEADIRCGLVSLTFVSQPFHVRMMFPSPSGCS
jgi:glutathionyl-hydroquinone reductase